MHNNSSAHLQINNQKAILIHLAVISSAENTVTDSEVFKLSVMEEKERTILS